MESLKLFGYKLQKIIEFFGVALLKIHEYLGFAKEISA
jgi:hypothetical protein